MHTVPMFISIVGGIVLFGPAGLIIGPLTVMSTITLLEIWRARADAKVP
jgi:predicted PurR-regulated permease PerM